MRLIRSGAALWAASDFLFGRKPPANEVVQKRLLPMVSPAAAEAPLCKGSWRRRRLRDCFEKHSETIPPSRHTPCHLPLHKGGGVSRSICGCIANLQIPDVSVTFLRRRQRLTAKEQTTGFAGGFAFMVYCGVYYCGMILFASSSIWRSSFSLNSFAVL